jgi:hypothetical protein
VAKGLLALSGGHDCWRRVVGGSGSPLPVPIM